MPRNLKPLLLMQNHLPQLPTRRHTLRYPVGIMLQITIQRRHTLPELSFQPVEETTDLLTEYWQVTRLMTAFMPGMLCSSASSMPTNTSSDHKDIPHLVENKLLHVLYPPMQSPSDEEADREVAAICRAPVYYQVRSQLTRRHQYYMYNALDSIEETSREKWQHENSPCVQGPPVEH